VAQGLNLRKKRCEIVDWGVERGRAAMAAFPTTETVDPMSKKPESTGRDRVDPRKRAHRNGRCLFEGQIRKVPDIPIYNPKDGHLERGRTAMAAFLNQGNGVAIE